MDRLVFILPWNVGPFVEDAVPERQKRRIEKAVEKEQCTRWHNGGSRFRVLLRVPLPSGSKAQVHIGAKNLLSQTGGLRIDITPSKMTGADIEHLHAFVRRLIGHKYDELLSAARINRIDIAVDIVNCVLQDYLVSYKYGHELTMFGKRLRKDVTETLNFGSVTSAYRATVYDKRLENLDQAIRKLIAAAGAADDLADNLVRQVRVAKRATPMTRVEIRGVKLSRMRVHGLLAADKERFQRFTFTEINRLDELTDFTKVNFLALVRDVGLKAAKKVYKGHAEWKVIEAITTGAPAWWVPDTMWARGINRLRQSGIFPKTAFKAPPVKLRPDSHRPPLGRVGR